MPATLALRLLRIAARILTAAPLVCVPALATDAPAAADPAAEKAGKDKTPAPIPLAQVATEADSDTLSLRKLIADRRSQEQLAGIQEALPTLEREVNARERENNSILAQRPSLDLLRELDQRWNDIRARLGDRAGQLRKLVSGFDQDLETLRKLEETWLATAALARTEKAPVELLRRAESLLAGIADARRAVAQQRTEALRLQARVSDLDLRVQEALQANRQMREASVSQLLSRDSPPFWHPGWHEQAFARISAAAVEAVERQWTILEIYMRPRAAHVLLQITLLGALTALFLWVRGRLAHLVRQEPELRRAATVVEHPIASALVLTLLLTPWIYPQAPRLLWAISGVALLIPTVIVLRRLVSDYLLAPLYAVLAFFFVDQLRAVAASIDILPRVLFVLEMLAAVVFLAWFARRSRPDSLLLPSGRRASPVRIAATWMIVLCAATAAANALGYVALSNLVGNAVLDSMYAGLVLYTVCQLVDVLIAMAMRVRPLSGLGMVRTHRALLHRRTSLFVQWIAILVWVLYVLDRLAIRDFVLEGIGSVLRAQLRLGEIAISLSAILSFLVVVWLAFLVSRLVRFVLDEEVFPRAQLKRGIPYAITRTTHFAIIALGFILAMGAIGMEMTQFTILASAFTIGVGFGLQNIFNNFVSGLIVLYERPVQVGDVIQIDGDIGVVDRIGIRATVVRTGSRAEVIVPNGKLISDRVINWTLSGRSRVIELALSVTLQSDPAHVIAVLERVAHEHPAVLKTPAPKALVTRLGPDWMGIELRATVGDVEGWTTVRSELAIAAVAALRAAEVTLR